MVSHCWWGRGAGGLTVLGTLPTSTSNQRSVSVVGMVGMLGLYKLCAANQARRPSFMADFQPSLPSNHREAHE